MKRRVTVKFKILLWLACVAYCVAMLINQSSVIVEQKLELSRLEKELSAVEYEHEFLRNKLDYINSSEYIEEAARKKFGWVKEGEIVFTQTED